ncbi:M1 family metallopeptidase [soil metagenome]
MILSLLVFSAVAAPSADTIASSYQQGVAYTIEARLDEQAQVLRARARLEYTNNSPVSLDTIWLHQHLNAFRPNSAWARRELEYGVRRFQDLGPAEHAYERFSSVQVDGRDVAPVYPGAPDSTVVALPLPRSLLPGASITVEMDWSARPSTLPRRQGRAGRHYDFAQWYPRIAVHEAGGWQTQPLLPQGEFYGEFASYDVTVQVAADQVIGAVGVPVDGDPGWRPAPRTSQPLLQRDAYPARAPRSLGFLAAEPADGERRVRWRAEGVHHFAWSVDPDYILESGQTRRTGDAGGIIAVHVLYRPADQDWAGGVALGRTIQALDWVQQLFGPYPWPQLTNLRRIEGGGTEFPMMMMNGSPSEGLIVHEMVHQYLHGILANNEWRDGWLDEGFTDFITNWYHEEQGRTNVWNAGMAAIRERERLAQTYPIARPGAEFPDPATYTAMTYRKTGLIFRMLRDLVGEPAMRQVLRTYYTENKLQHVTEADLRSAVNQVTGEDFDWFFQQWFHTTGTLDYAFGHTSTERMADGRWRTRVDVLRLGQAWMPVRVQVGDQVHTLSSRNRRQTLELITREHPREAAIDPDNILIDLDPSTNRVRL